MAIVQLYNSQVPIVVDTSVLIAVLTGEAERRRLVRATKGATLVAPASVHWEVGNALSALLRRKRITRSDLESLLAAYDAISIRFVDVDLGAALELAADHALYAYDAYLLACAISQRAPLLTLDQTLSRAAHAAGIRSVELPE